MLVIRYLAKKLNESQAVRKDKQEIAEVLWEEFRNSFNESMKREIRQLRESLEELKQARGATSAEVGVTVARHSQ